MGKWETTQGIQTVNREDLEGVKWTDLRSIKLQAKRVRRRDGSITDER